MGDDYVVKQISPEVEGAGNTALILEIVFGIFGLLGIGHVYTNRTALGIGLMVGWWIYIVIAAAISSLTLGFAACIFVPLSIAIPIISGVQARTYARQNVETGNWGSVAKVAGGGCLLVVLSIVLIFFVFGGLAALFSLAGS